MPTYEYSCGSCGEHLEVVQSFKDEPLTECPHCGGALRKVFGSIGIVFKGSGFYKTDSRGGSKSEKPAEKAETKSGSESKASESKSSDSSAKSKESSGSAKENKDASSSSKTSSQSSAAAAS